MNKIQAISLALLAHAVVACGSNPADEPKDSSQKPAAFAQSLAVGSVADRVRSVSRVRSARGELQPLKEEPAAEALSAIRSAVKGGGKLSVPMRVYELAPVVTGAEKSRGLSLGVGALEEASDTTKLPSAHLLRSKAAPGYLMRTDDRSGFEALIDQTRFHSGAHPGKDLGDAFYATKARGYARGASRAASSSSSYLYRIRRFMDASGTVGQAPTTQLSQVAVSFNDAIDDIPVIGPGSKFSVHMTPAGDVVGHVDSTRATKVTPFAELALASLSDPDQAQAEVESRLAARGVNLAKFDLKRQEFGYFRGGRHDVQTLLAPHYLFVYEPKAGITAKRLVELIPAVSDASLRARIEREHSANHQHASDAVTHKQ